MKSNQWLALAHDTLTVLRATADDAMQRTRGVVNWSAEAVAVRLLLRSCGNLDGVIVLCERGLVAESRILSRCLIENSFGVAALHDKPVEYISMLKEDSERSRRNQAEFILSFLSPGADHRRRLQQTKDAIQKKAKIISPKELAGMGALQRQYLGYQRLSDDAAHVTARSLQRHVQVVENGQGWHYRCQDGTAEAHASTLHFALMAALSVGIGVTQMLHADAQNAAFEPLCRRFQAMPSVDPI